MKENAAVSSAQIKGCLYFGGGGTPFVIYYPPPHAHTHTHTQPLSDLIIHGYTEMVAVESGPVNSALTSPNLLAPSSRLSTLSHYPVPIFQGACFAVWS